MKKEMTDLEYMKKLENLNMIEPETGKHILDCAFNKQKQSKLF